MADDGFLVQLVDSLDVGAVALANDRLRCNHSAELLLGARPESRDELLDLLTAHAGSDDARQSYRIEIGHALDAGSAERLSLPAGNQWGNDSTIELSMGRLGDAGGTSLLLLSSPERDAASRVQVARTERLAALGQLSAGVTHEVNNVLTAILGWTQIALKAPDQPDKVNSALDIIDENCRRAKGIIDDVMHYARGEDSHIEPVPVSEVVDEVLRVMSWQLKQANVTVSRDFADVPNVMANRRKLFQVFLNLALNSLQAMPDGGQLRVTTRHGADDLVFAEVADTGVGMTSETLAKIFDPLFTTKRQGARASGGGSGMGLAISRRIVDELEGEIDVTSEPGGGATFTVVLAPAKDAKYRRSDTSRLSNKLSAGLRILVVDNEVHIRNMLKDVLSGDAAEVVTAADADEALQATQGQTFDIGLVDYTMPGGSGAELISSLRGAQPAMKLITLSGRPELVTVDESGADLCLRKPLELGELRNAIGKLLP